VRVPEAAKPGTYTVSVLFPLGPLCGDAPGKATFEVKTAD
jgi:hypothetical protein